MKGAGEDPPEMAEGFVVLPVSMSTGDAPFTLSLGPSAGTRLTQEESKP